MVFRVKELTNEEGANIVNPKVLLEHVGEYTILISFVICCNIVCDFFCDRKDKISKPRVRSTSTGIDVVRYNA